ncbi:glycosyltransferase [Cellulomonas dongxiuzhuiae]|uniref:glycosyltransferase n=1 Tax=Cellulomonas dongxiuzhuiae TaxID=2819979 RepID=UPI001AAFBB38|nr:glycosyltransferase [Cellulomonas dongxiuzhuiae]MBO3088803.1 glycosyltransferase [Cellulomonas dongxiuzhuiae]
MRDWADELTDDERALLESLPEGYCLAASRLVDYKRIDLALKAAEEAREPIVVAGTGPLEAEIRSQIERMSVPALLITSPSTPLLLALYQRARVMLFPAIEDFGIMPVEAMAIGTPVIGRAVGGVSESVSHVGGGVLVSSDSPSEWAQSIRTFPDFDRAALRDRATYFSAERFRAEIAEIVRGVVDDAR